MSHFTKIKTKIFKKEILIKSLENLGFLVDQGISILRGYDDLKRDVDFVIKLESSYNIGFALTEDGSYEIIADWWGVEDHDKEEFTRKVVQNYAMELIRVEMNKKGFNVVEQKTLEDNSIKLIVRKWRLKTERN